MAYERLLLKYQRTIYNLCYRLVSNAETATDLAQESFIKAFKNLKKYDSSYRFSTWLIRISTNHCYDHLRKNRPAMISIDDDNTEDRQRPFELPDERPNIDQQLAQSERNRKIQEAISKLPPDSRTAIVLRHMHDKSYEEIAEILNEPVGTIKARIHRARKRLAELLSPDLLNE